MSDEPAESWRCFHCGEVFTDREAAADHFGTARYLGLWSVCSPACTVSVHEFRQIEFELERYRHEDSDKDREMSAMVADHQRALVREEEKGYARGLRDMQAMFDGLKRDVSWFLDLLPDQNDLLNYAATNDGRASKSDCAAKRIREACVGFQYGEAVPAAATTEVR